MPSLARLLAIGCVAVGVGIVVASVSVAPAWATGASGCPRTGELPSDPDAEALIASIETEFRRGPRIVRMDIRTVYTRSRGIGRCALAVTTRKFGAERPRNRRINSSVS